MCDTSSRTCTDKYVVLIYGYFEWLKKGKEKLPHFFRRKEGRLMILAALYDSAILDGKYYSRNYRVQFL